jgi:ABC-type sugar transport system substrate-binding protein
MGSKRMLAAVTAAAVLALTACSSGGSGGAGGGGGDSAGLKTAETRVADFTAHTTPMEITDPVKVPDKPMTFVFMQCVQTVCKEIGDGLETASAAIGAKLIRITHQDTPETVQQAAVNALQQNPTAVFFSGDPTEWFSAQLDEMKAKGIPVVGWSLEGGFTPDKVSANLLNQDDYYFIGVLEADWVVAKTGGKGTSLLLNVPSYPVLATAGKGYTEEMARVCPDCKVETADFTVDDIVSGNVATAAVAALQRNPDTKYIVGTFGGLITQQLAQAVKGAGFTDVKAISASGTAANYQLIKDGELEEADLALPSSYLAWRTVDVTLRLLAGQDVNQSATKPASADIPGHPDLRAGGVPQEFITKDQITGDVTSVDQLWTPVENYQDAFKKLWGVS